MLRGIFILFPFDQAKCENSRNKSIVLSVGYISDFDLNPSDYEKNEDESWNQRFYQHSFVISPRLLHYFQYRSFYYGTLVCLSLFQCSRSSYEPVTIDDYSKCCK